MNNPAPPFCPTCGLFKPCQTCGKPRIGLAPMAEEQALTELRTLLMHTVGEAFDAGIKFVEGRPSRTLATGEGILEQLMADEIERIVTKAMTTRLPR